MSNCGDDDLRRVGCALEWFGGEGFVAFLAKVSLDLFSFGFTDPIADYMTLDVAFRAFGFIKDFGL